MTSPFNVPEITVQEVARKREIGDDVVLLDVRETYELVSANLGNDVELAPLSELAERHLDALPDVARNQEAEIIVFCHHGVRSAQVVAWLRSQGWTNVWNMRGGIDAYAREVDPSIGFY